MKKKIVIGGEYYYSPSIILKKKKFDIYSYLKEKYPNKEFSFTGGAYYSLFRIIDDIGFEKEQEILLPSYLCPTILIPFKKRNVKYNFFGINEKLEIDIEDLKSKISEQTRAVFFINYFGFPPDIKTKNFIKQLKRDGIIIIEDCVQSFFSDIELIGNYVFNSFRKFLHIDGSVIISEHLIESTDKEKEFTKYFFLKSIGQFLKMLTVEIQFIDFSKLYLRLFAEANVDYYKHTNVKMNWWSKFILSKHNINKLKKRRKENFEELLTNLKSISIFDHISENITPLGFIVKFDGSRDQIKEKLMRKNIYCPVHWRLSDEIDKQVFKESWYLSNNILTLPLNESISNVELNYLYEKYGGIL